MALTQTIESIDPPSERLSPDTYAWRRESGAAVAPLWVRGAAVLCLLLAVVVRVPLTAISARAEVWVPYLALGTLFPLLVAAIVAHPGITAIRPNCHHPEQAVSILTGDWPHGIVPRAVPL